MIDNYLGGRERDGIKSWYFHIEDRSNRSTLGSNRGETMEQSYTWWHSQKTFLNEFLYKEMTLRRTNFSFRIMKNVSYNLKEYVNFLPI